MIILGIDPSLTNTGYCILDTSKNGIDSIVSIGVIQTPENMLEILRYSYIADSIEKLIKKYKIEYAGSEGPIFGCEQSENLFALYSYIKKTFFKQKINVVYFAPVQLKMLAKQDLNNKLKMTKLDMINTMLKELNLNKASVDGQRITADMADAFHVAFYASRFWFFYQKLISEKDLNGSEYKAFAYQHIFKRGIKKGKIDPKERGIIFKENELFFRFSDQKQYKKVKAKIKEIR